MLADKILAAADGVVGDFSKLTSTIRTAHRFTMTPAFVTACDTIARFNPTSLERMHGMFRLPFPVTWFEVEQNHREVSRSGRLLPGTTAGVDRVGVLMRQPEKDAPITIDLFWNFVRSTLCMSWGARVYTPGEPAYADEAEEQRIRSMLAGRSDMTGAHLEAAIRHNGRFTSTYSDFRKDEMQMKLKQDGFDALKTINDSIEVDWAGEENFWLAAISMLNSRNVVELDDAPSRASARLSKLRRKPEPLAYVQCDIARRIKSKAPREDGAAPAGETMRAHFVRGHFKTRKSGIYWWAGHARGDISKGFVTKDYRLL